MINGCPVLAVLNRPETAAAVLDAASAMCRLPGAGPLELLWPRPDLPPDFLPTEEVAVPERLAAFERDEAELGAALRERVRGALPHPPPLHEECGTVRRVVATAAERVALAVLGAPGQDRDSPARQALDGALFDARAPLLLVPEHTKPFLIRTVAVAWEDSPAAIDALDAAMPLLRAAEWVVVLVAEEGHKSVALPPALSDALHRHEAHAEVRRFSLDGRHVGEAVLDEAAASGADLLVMGAFTHPRFIEALFGGATREVLEGTGIPVLLHH